MYSTWTIEWVGVAIAIELGTFAEIQLPAPEQNVREARASVEARRG